METGSGGDGRQRPRPQRYWGEDHHTQGGERSRTRGHRSLGPDSVGSSLRESQPNPLSASFFNTPILERKAQPPEAAGTLSKGLPQPDPAFRGPPARRPFTGQHGYGGEETQKSPQPPSRAEGRLRPCAPLSVRDVLRSLSLGWGGQWLS